MFFSGFSSTPPPPPPPCTPEIAVPPSSANMDLFELCGSCSFGNVLNIAVDLGACMIDSVNDVIDDLFAPVFGNTATSFHESSHRIPAPIVCVLGDRIERDYQVKLEKLGRWIATQGCHLFIEDGACAGQAVACGFVDVPASERGGLCIGTTIDTTAATTTTACTRISSNAALSAAPHIELPVRLAAPAMATHILSADIVICLSDDAAAVADSHLAVQQGKPVVSICNSLSRSSSSGVSAAAAAPPHNSGIYYASTIEDVTSYIDGILDIVYKSKAAAATVTASSSKNNTQTAPHSEAIMASISEDFEFVSVVDPSG